MVEIKVTSDHNSSIAVIPQEGRELFDESGLFGVIHIHQEDWLFILNTELNDSNIARGKMNGFICVGRKDGVIDINCCSRRRAALVC
jgi:hypothetical protein